MSYSQSNSYCYDNNHVADDDLSTVFDADTVKPDEVPSLPAMPALPTLTATVTTTVTTDYLYNNNNATISSSPHSSQKESPQSFTSELLRRINSQLSVAISSTATATATRSEEISTNKSSSSSSSKKRPIITNSSSHSSKKKTRRSSRLKRQPQDQSYVDKSDSEVEDENGRDEAVVINQSSSSQTSTTKLTKKEANWKNKFEKLRAYKQLHGHANVPRNNKELGRWVNTQRTEYRKFIDNKHSYITEERIEMLESIDFEWVSQYKTPRNESKWNERFNELKAYKEKYNDTNVPNKSKDYKELGLWVGRQRAEYKKFKKNGKTKITPERIEMLNSIDFEWEINSEWNERFNELKEYKDKYGDTNVPQDFKDNKQLGKWVSHQRSEYKNFQKKGKSPITLERIQMLESIGFQWECRPGPAPRKKS